MTFRAACSAAVLLALISAAASSSSPRPDAQRVLVKTELGEILLEVDPARAPVTAGNFLGYVDAGLYDGTSFFRTVTLGNQPRDTVKIEVIQGGEVDPGKSFPPIVHETTRATGMRHAGGAVSMARAAPGSATSSFFICVNDQPELDFGGRRNPDGQGFAAFGRVVSGMDVVRKIQLAPADGQRLTPPVLIRTARRAD